MGWHDACHIKYFHKHRKGYVFKTLFQIDFAGVLQMEDDWSDNDFYEEIGRVPYGEDDKLNADSQNDENMSNYQENPSNPSITEENGEDIHKNLPTVTNQSSSANNELMEAGVHTNRQEISQSAISSSDAENDVPLAQLEDELPLARIKEKIIQKRMQNTDKSNHDANQSPLSSIYDSDNVTTRNTFLRVSQVTAARTI